MFIGIKVQNYLSFKELTSFSMEAASLHDKKDTHTFLTGVNDISLLKTAAIYGPNGSGKSNLLKAIEFVVSFIRNSAKEFQAEEEIPVKNFKLSTLTENQPSYFEIEIIVQDTKYRYGFEVTSKEVEREWLYMTKKQKEYVLFERTHSSYKVDVKFAEGKGIADKTRPNALYLSAVAQWNGKISVSIIEAIKQMRFFNDVLDFKDFSRTTEMMEDEKYRGAILQFLKSADLGITDVKTEPVNFENDLYRLLLLNDKKGFPGKANKLKTVKTSHAKFNQNQEKVGEVFLDLASEESLGTQKIFSLAGPIIDALWNGKVLIIDEFTSRMHPMLTSFIVKQFNSSKDNYNRGNAQLIFASHNFGIMERELFRRDQIFLTRKNSQNATQITTFFKEGVRHDTSFRGQYFSKGFGAKPNIDEGEQLPLF